MGTVDELKAVRARVTECLALASAHFGRDFPEIPVLFNLTGKTGGMFRYRIDPNSHQLIDLSFRFNRILARENLAEYLGQVCPHEVAHYITRSVWGMRVSTHGKEWQSVMTGVFKLAPDRCHSMDTSRAMKKEFLYQCGCGGREHRLSTTRHNRVARGYIYHCNKCGKNLEFLKQADKAQAQFIPKLFISTAGCTVEKSHVDRIAGLIVDHQVGAIVADWLIADERHLQLLSKKLKVPLSSVARHTSSLTLPGGVTHAIVFADSDSERQGRVAKAFEQRGVKVRMVRAGAG